MSTEDDRDRESSRPSVEIEGDLMRVKASVPGQDPLEDLVFDARDEEEKTNPVAPAPVVAPSVPVHPEPPAITPPVVVAPVVPSPPHFTAAERKKPPPMRDSMLKSSDSIINRALGREYKFSRGRFWSIILVFMLAGIILGITIQFWWHTCASVPQGSERTDVPPLPEALKPSKITLTPAHKPKPARKPTTSPAFKTPPIRFAPDIRPAKEGLP